MKEDFLHYIWKFKKFDFLNLETSLGKKLTILDVGQYTQLEGPDFFNAQIIVKDQKWAGNIEIHLKSSDWFAHNHERDANYDSVILHVVWEHDVEIFSENNIEIPVLVLKNYVEKQDVENYKTLMQPKSWIYCEKKIGSIEEFTLKNWQERLFFERLERKSIPINELLASSNNDWESVLFAMLCKNFGLNTNGNSFLEMAQKIPFSIIRKELFEVKNLEALFFGFTGILENEKEDNYYKDLKFRFYYLLQKYRLENIVACKVEFFKHRPDNFPTIRLSQLASLINKEQNLFSKIISCKSIEKIYDLFSVSVSDYWKTHYTFDKDSPKKDKLLSKSFIDLLIINTIIPFQFAYAKSQNKEISEDILALLCQVKPESNSIINKFALFGVKAQNAFETQSLLQLKNEYCNKSYCLDCSIGMELLKN